MKKLVVILGIVLASTAAFADDRLAKFDVNKSATVYLVKGTLVQENETVRSIWAQFDYTKEGSLNLKENLRTIKTPSSSKVKYAFNCSNMAHKVIQATVLDNKGLVITNLQNGTVEDVVPGSVGEAIRNFVCSYDMENDRVGEQKVTYY